jgi:hypothetical protein
MKETNLLRACLLQVPSSCRMFRNNTGQGWQGQRLQSRPGTVLLSDPRPLHAGLVKGSSDLIGWKTITVTPEMVGRKLAIFAAVEVKTERGRITVDQLNFIEQVRSAGGIAGIARSPEEARNLLETYL